VRCPPGLHRRSIAGDGDPIPLASEVHELDFEVELVIVIGKRTKRVAEADALAHVRLHRV
jgi:2-keto-4-pentenoate hydratase/2-oxohepta-3-ene-1,7-dioic acid hydratase in catechol pathway